MGKKVRRGAVRTRRGKAGETLTETLVTMLIVGLSSVLFLTMVGASGKIFRMSETKYKELYEKIAAADVQDSGEISSLGSITVQGSSSSATIAVDWYGGTDYVVSYKK